MATSLVMAFRTSDNKLCNIKINDPKDDLTKTQVETVMNTVITKNVFETATAAKLTAIDKIYTITTAKTELLI